MIFAFSDCAIASLTCRARPGRSTRAVASAYPSPGLYVCCDSDGRYSTSIGDSFANACASSTACFNAASLTSVVDAEPRRLPIHTVTRTETPSRRPLVRNVFAANRRCE